MAALRMSIPITKVDAAQRLVYGLATAEIADRSGEICDYATTKPLYVKWSQAIEESTGGKSLGNVRSMHSAIAAGKVTALTFNDQEKQIEICAKVIDDAEWAKVEEGVYTGFSQGGVYAKRWTDETGAQRYTAEPHEISLVDLPCLPEAKFAMIKVDGTFEARPFKVAVEVKPEPEIDNITLPPTESIEKIGARNNEADQTRIQHLHDTAVDLGAVCGAAKIYTVDLTKHFDVLADRLMTKLDDMTQRLKAIEDEPRPLPFAMQARAVSKHDDASLEKDNRIEALLADPKALSLLAIKLAQRQGDAHRR
jgi:hypothetical protein